MNPYPFKIPSEHKTFNVTFLQSVILKIEYDYSKESYNEFADFFRKSFNLNLSENQFNLKDTDAIRIVSKNKEYRVKFSKSLVELVLAGDTYTNFDSSLAPFISNFASYVDSLDGKVLSISINKIDIWPSQELTDSNLKTFTEAILSHNLLISPFINREEGGFFLKFNDDENNDVLLIREAFFPYTDENPDLYARLVLDSMVKHEEPCVAANELSAIARRLNDVLYSAFIWCVSAEVIKIMES